MLFVAFVIVSVNGNCCREDATQFSAGAGAVVEVHTSVQEQLSVEPVLASYCCRHSEFFFVLDVAWHAR